MEKWIQNYTILHVVEQALHLWPGRDGLAAAHLLITPGDIEPALLSKLEQGGPVPGQRISLAVGLGLQVYTGFTEIQVVATVRIPCNVGTTCLI